MWWLSRNGQIQGPFPEGEMRRQIALNLIRSLDRVSEDRCTWQFVRNTSLWAPPAPPLPPPPPAPSAPPPVPRVIKIVHASPPEAPKRENREEPPPESLSEVLKHISQKRPLKREVQVGVPPNRSGWWWAIGGAVGMAIVLVAFVFARPSCALSRPKPPPASPATPEEPQTKCGNFADIKHALAIIENNDGGAGSGFLLNWEGRPLLVSNEHVLRSSSTPTAKLLDGRTLRLGRFAVAEDGRDLACFEVLGYADKCLEADVTLPDTGDEVVLYGNSLGGGVATESRGKILGVGPATLETDAAIVGGNSGSPIITRKGNVIGVAAYMTKRNENDIWVKDTRYEQTRRFAVRLNGVRWRFIDRREYERQVADFETLDTYWRLLVPYLVVEETEGKKDAPALASGSQIRHALGNDREGFRDILLSVLGAWEDFEDKREDLRELAHRREAFLHRIDQRSDTRQRKQETLEAFDYEMGTKHTLDACIAAERKFILERKEALLLAQRFLRKGFWLAPQMRKGYSSRDYDNAAKGYEEAITRVLEHVNGLLENQTHWLDRVGLNQEKE